MRRRREKAAWITAEAEVLIRELGAGGRRAARWMERTANDMPAMRFWRAVKDAIAPVSDDDERPSAAVAEATATAEQGPSAPTKILAEAAPPGVPENESDAAFKFQVLAEAFARFPRVPKDGDPSRPAEDRESAGRFLGGAEIPADVLAFDWDSSRTGSMPASAPSTVDHAAKPLEFETAMVSTPKINSSLSPMTQDAQYRLLVEAISDYAIYMLDPTGAVMSWNAGAQKFKGYAASEIVGKNFAAFYTAEDRAKGEPRRALETAEREGRFESEGWRIRQDGSRFWANVVVDPILSPDGALIGFAKITRDVTRQKEAQRALEQAQAALVQSQKMDAIGQLTASAAHDFNNLLDAILTSLNLARRHAPDDPAAARLTDNAVLAAQRGAALTRRMLAFSRHHELKSESINLPTLVEGMLDLLQSCMGSSTSIETRLPSTSNTILSDPNQLELALINLALNARDAMPKGGAVTIAIREERVTAAHETRLPPGDYACLSVADAGKGMDAATLSRAVEPFFTTKGTGKGAGLGLSMTHGVVTQSGGRLVLKSVEGEGTTVELWFPLETAVGKAAGVPTGAAGATSRIGPLRILAVDDDGLVLMNLVAMLEDLGHKVVPASSGKQALDLLWREPAFDLMVTDQVMPEMTGAALAEAARQAQPTLRVIVAAGYGEGPSEGDPDVVKIAKPFRQEDLASAISDACGREAARTVLKFPVRGARGEG